MCEVFTADTILKQTEEDCRYLCTGDGILRLYFAIPVTNNVSKVVSVVQTQCVIIRNFYCRLGLGTMSAPPPPPPLGGAGLYAAFNAIEVVSPAMGVYSS